MNIEELRDYCLSLKGVEEGFPFDESTLVFKVMGKMFLACNLERNPLAFNVKCEPNKAIDLREEYTGVLPGYHMNKKHWNTVVFDGSFDYDLAKQWISDSYELVVASLSKKFKKRTQRVVMGGFFRKSVGYFLQGLLFITPIAVTIFVIMWFVNFLDNLFEPLLGGLLPYHIPGFGLLFAFFWLAVLGYLIAHLVSRSAISWFDGLMHRAPLVKVIYFAVKDLITVFFGKEDKMGKPVRVLTQRDPLQYKFGFVTRHDLSDFNIPEDMISVYLPFSYGVMGNQVVVRKDEVEYLDVPSAEVMKFIVSGGVVQKSEKK